MVYGVWCMVWLRNQINGQNILPKSFISWASIYVVTQIWNDCCDVQGNTRRWNRIMVDVKENMSTTSNVAF